MRHRILALLALVVCVLSPSGASALLLPALALAAGHQTATTVVALPAGVATVVPGTDGSPTGSGYHLVNTTVVATFGSTVHVNATGSTDGRDDVASIAAGGSANVAAAGPLFAWSVNGGTLTLTNPKSVSPGQADLRYSPAAVSRGPANLALVSDSTGEGQTSQATGSHAGSWFVDYAYASDGAMCIRRNASHGGYTTQQLSALFATEVAPYSPDGVLVGSGRNDVASDIQTISSGTPAQVYVTEANGHRVLEGHRVWITGCGSASGLWYAHVVDSRTLQLFANPELTVGVAGPSSYAGGGVCSSHYGAATEMIEAAQAAGIPVALLTMCPIGSPDVPPSATALLYTQRIEAENRLLSQTYGIPLFPVGAWVADAGGQYRLGLDRDPATGVGDGVHPKSFAAQALIGEGVWSASAPWIGRIRAAKAMAGASAIRAGTGYFSSHYPNGVPYDTSNQGGADVGTFAYASANPAGVVGTEASMTRGAGAVTTFFGLTHVSVGSGQAIAAGDRVRVELHFRGSNMVPSGAFFGLGVVRDNGAAYGGNTSIVVQADHAKRGCLSLDFTASSDTTGFLVRASAGWTSTTLSAIFRYSEMRVIDLSKSGTGS